MLPFYPDILLSGEIRKEYKFIEIASFQLEKSAWIAGLVVQLAQDNASVFERVGMAGCVDRNTQTTDARFMDAAEMETVILV